MMYSRSLSKLPECHQCRDDDQYSCLSSSTTGEDNSGSPSGSNMLSGVGGVGDMFDLSLLKSVTFLLVGLSGIIVFTGIYAVFQKTKTVLFFE